MNHWIIESKSREVLNRKWEWNPRVKVTTDICNSCFDRDAKSGRGKHAPAIVPFWFIVHVCVQRMFIRVFSPGWNVYPVPQLVHKHAFRSSVLHGIEWLRQEKWKWTYGIQQTECNCKYIATALKRRAGRGGSRALQEPCISYGWNDLCSIPKAYIW